MYLDDVDVRYRALVDVAGALTSHSDLTDLLRSLRGHLEPIVQFTFLSVWLWDRDADRLTVAFVEPAETPAARLVGESYPAADTYPGQAVQTGRPVYVTDVDPAGPSPSQVMIEHGVQSYCAVPLVTRARHHRHAQLRLARSRRLHGRRHRADVARRRAGGGGARERPQRRDDPRTAGRPAARARSARPAARGDQRGRHPARHAGAVPGAGAGPQAGLQRRVRGALALRSGDARCCASTPARARPSSPASPAAASRRRSTRRSPGRSS